VAAPTLVDAAGARLHRELLRGGHGCGDTPRRLAKRGWRMEELGGVQAAGCWVLSRMHLGARDEQWEVGALSPAGDGAEDAGETCADRRRRASWIV
jgi:hypothetical protein